MTGRGRNVGLFEFLEEAELQQYYNSLKNILQVHNVQQLKYVVDEDLFNIGMSRPEAKRLKTFFHKLNPQNYASKLKKLLRPTKNKDESKHEYLLGEDESLSSSKVKRYSSLGSIKVPSQHIIPIEAITIHKELGVGEFGVVQQGVWTDEDQMRHQVAIKCLSKERMQNNTFEFMKEYDIMQSIDHPHIVRLYGVVLDPNNQIMLITELAPLRSLLECLKEPSLRSTFSVTCLANFASQICEGMKYLETKRLIHRDLAARNILVFSKSIVKVSDFGLSRALGVGKDYYQTNFNVNLKLPIAWCAPECINFLKFTSASDVWAFGVTLWEMFSYGFQPWAAQTGQQILEAIDEPQCQRLEQPDHCPNDYYSVMLQCWRHEPAKRPTFEQLASILDEAKPEQLQAVTSTLGFNAFNTSKTREMLEFEIGDIITVLDKQSVSSSTSCFWKGTLPNGRVGLFDPNHTVAYIGTLPSQGNYSKWQNEDIYQSTRSGPFQRNSLRSSSSSRYGSKRKISRDMISGPRGDVQHTGHVGPDGVYFGNVGFNVGNLKQEETIPFTSMPSLTRADSDASEKAPLLSGRGGSTSSGTSVQAHPTQAESQTSTTANKNPRMGYAIGYLRKSSTASQHSHVDPVGSTQPHQPHRLHEYQTISDDELGGPLDLGPSLLDEVFSELDSSKDSGEQQPKDQCDGDLGQDREEEKREHRSRLHTMKDMKELVSSTLTLSSRRHKKRQQATVKPIKASDEKRLDEAIAMANALASKSLHDLDKRHLDDFYDHSPPHTHSPQTPTSPSKRFSFWYPGKTTSPREGRHFTDAENPDATLESILTPGAKDAYKVLIEGSKCNLNDQPDGRDGRAASPRSPTRSTMTLPTATTLPDEPHNPLPLPPKSQRLNLSQPPKRHVRKNPLIIPSGTTSNLLLRSGGTTSEEIQSTSSYQPHPTLNKLNNNASHHQLHDRDNNGGLLESDAFENQIACSMDALDNIGPGSLGSDINSELASRSISTFGGDALPLIKNHQDHVSAEDVQPRVKKGGRESDEVRIMTKVLGIDLDPETCVAALNTTDWNVHHAIKLVKLRNLIRATSLSDSDLKAALQTRDWDVAKAANILMKQLKE